MNESQTPSLDIKEDKRQITLTALTYNKHTEVAN